MSHVRMIRGRENFIAEIRVFLLCHFYEQPVCMNHFRFCPFAIAEKRFVTTKLKREHCGALPVSVIVSKRTKSALTKPNTSL